MTELSSEMVAQSCQICCSTQLVHGIPMQIIFPFLFLSLFLLSTSLYYMVHLASQLYYPSCSLHCISIPLCLGHFLGSWYLKKRKCLNELCFTVALHQQELLFSFLGCCPDSCLWFVLFHRIIFIEQPGLEGHPVPKDHPIPTSLLWTGQFFN